MSPALSVALDEGPVERAAVELAVAGFFETDRPLRGEAGRADWRLCGMLSELLRRGRLRGAAGEAVLVPTMGCLRAPRLLLLGLGRSTGFGAAEARSFAQDAARRGLRLRAASLALPLPGHWTGQLPAGPGAAALLRGAAAALEELGGSLQLRVLAPPGSGARVLGGVESAARQLAAGPVTIRLAGPELLTVRGSRTVPVAAGGDGRFTPSPQRY